MRPVNSAMLGFAVIVGAAIVAGHPPPAVEALAAYLTGFFIGASAMVLNDIADVEVDRVNAPDRPIPSGRLSVREAWACFWLLSLAGLACAAATGLATLLVALAAWATASAYDLGLKRRGLPGNIIVAFNVAVPLLYGAALVGRYAWVVAVYWLMVFLTALAREVAKGIADVEGDKKNGIRTVAVAHGVRRAANLSAILYLAAVALSPIPAMKRWVSVEAYAPLITLVDAMLLYATVRLMASPDKATALWHKRVVLAAMLIGLIGFYLGVSGAPGGA